MKPVIMDETKSLNALTVDFTNGLGRLSDIVKAEVIEEANGQYEATFDIPIDSVHFDKLHVGGIVKMKANEFDEDQLFRVYKITKPLSGVCTVMLQHISYDLNKVAVRPLSTTGAGAAVAGINNNMMGVYPFSIRTDITNTTSSYSLAVPTTARSAIGGIEGSFIDVFGGEIHWNNLITTIMAHRGSDRGVRISYGKNLVDYRQEVNNANVYDAVVGYATQDDVTITGDVQYAVQVESPKTQIIDFTNDFGQDEEITVQKLNRKAQEYIRSNNIGIPDVNIEVDFIHLWQTEEYKDIASLERVALFDTVHVFIPKLGVEATAKVVRTVFDPISERYTKIELGSVRADLGGVISKSTDKKVGVVARSIFDRVTYQIDSQIERATAFLTGAEGGYQITHYNNDGKPYETLWMDSPDESTATHILRINANGLGFSNDGGATYRNAWLIDGTLSADFIGSGTIDAINITGSNITGGVIDGAEIDSGDMYWYKGTANEVSIRKAKWNGHDGVRIRSNQFVVGDKDNNSYINVNNSYVRLYAGSFVSVDDSGIFLQGKYGNGAITVNNNNVVLRMNGEQHGLKWVTIDGYKVPVAV